MSGQGDVGTGNRRVPLGRHLRTNRREDGLFALIVRQERANGIGQTCPTIVISRGYHGRRLVEYLPAPPLRCLGLLNVLIDLASG